jgi:hypothetical protein
MSPNAGGGVLRGLSQWVQLCTWSPNKLWRSNSIFDLSQPLRCEFFYLYVNLTLLLRCYYVVITLLLRCYYVVITSFIDGKTGKRREQTVKHSVADFIDENGVVCQVNQSVVNL